MMLPDNYHWSREKEGQRRQVQRPLVRHDTTDSQNISETAHAAKMEYTVPVRTPASVHQNERSFFRTCEFARLRLGRNDGIRGLQKTGL